MAAAVLWPAPHASAAVASGAVRAGSSPGLRFGSSALARTDFLPISPSPHGAAKVLYSVRLDGSRPAGSTVTVRGLMQVTYCRSTDLAGTNKPAHPCVGTHAYSFEPVVYARLVVAGSPYATTGRVIRPWRGAICHRVIHHCPLAVAVNHVAVSGAAKYVNLVASAQSSRATGGQIVAIDPTTGGLQVIQSLGRPAARRTLTSGPRLSVFPLSPGGVQAPKASQRPSVIFSQPVTVEAGDVLDVSTHFKLTIHNSKDNAPLARAWIVLATRPTAAYLPPGMPVIARAGQNCLATCTLTRVAALRSAVTGRRYVNVGVVVKDHEGETAATASYSGVLRVTKR